MPVASFPSWVLLEPFVLRRDDDESFPDDTKAPIRATATTTWGATFRIAFSLAEPPKVSLLYAQLPVPGFPDRWVSEPLGIVATHRHLVLFRVGTFSPETPTVQNFFIFRADDKRPCSLHLLPACTEPTFDYTTTPESGQLPYCGRLPDANPRLLNVRSLGLWCRGKGFVVAELRLFQPIYRPKIFADICLLNADGVDAAGRTWKTFRVEILSASNTSDANLWQLCCWSSDAVIPFGKRLCWIDYQRGILLCDMSQLPNPPTISFTWFPVGKLPPTATRYVANSFFYRGVSVVHEHTLKFINVTRDDGIPFGALGPGGSFTITCHTLTFESDRPKQWKEDYKLTSRELWDANTADLLPRDILIYPQVDINRPHVAHFLFIEFGCTIKKMSVVTIDMSTKTVESCSPCINGEEGLKTDYADLVMDKSLSPKPFLPCEFSKFLNLSSKDVAESSLPTSSSPRSSRPTERPPSLPTSSSPRSSRPTGRPPSRKRPSSCSG